MDQQPTKLLERPAEDSLRMDSFFEEFCGSQTDHERTLTADGLWALSDDSMMLLAGMDSTHTSEVSGFTAFLELTYNENPSAIFNQSLDVFSGAAGSSASLVASSQQPQQPRELQQLPPLQHVHAPDQKKEDSGNGKNESAELLPLDYITEFLNNPLADGDADDALGWSCGLFESQIPAPMQSDGKTRPLVLSTRASSNGGASSGAAAAGATALLDGTGTKVKVENVPPAASRVTNASNKANVANAARKTHTTDPLLRQGFDGLQRDLVSVDNASADSHASSHASSLAISQPSTGTGTKPHTLTNSIPKNLATPSKTAKPTKMEDSQLPWEWHTFDFDNFDPTITGTWHTNGLSQPAATQVAFVDLHPKTSLDSPIGKATGAEQTTDDGTGKKERRKPKPIAKRFQPFGRVTVVPSYVQCLNIVLDYHGYTGNITQIILNNSITNVAYQQHDSIGRASLMKKPLSEFYIPPAHEELVGAVPAPEGGSCNAISIISGVLQRKVHLRDISSIFNSVQLVAYVKSGRFSIHNPYEPQYYRYELDAKGKAVNESKCGMCAFCPAVKFLPFKNSSYLSHMTLEHGIFASNFVVPEGLYYGRYRMVRSTDPTKTRTVKALQCPACFQVIEVACWKNKTNPLLSYFRHFKKLHLNLNKTFTSSTIDPVTLKHRGANIALSEGLGLAKR